MPRRTNRTTVQCSGPCREYKDENAFSANDHLLDGRSPWCRECVAALTDASGPEAAEVREAYRKAYQQAYHAKRSADSGGPVRPRWSVEMPGGRAVATVSRSRNTVSVTGSWKMRDDVVGFAERLCGGVGAVTVAGRGGGRGRRQHSGVRAIATGCASQATDELSRMETQGLAKRLRRKKRNA